MDAAIFDCPMEWEGFLPPGTRRVRRVEELRERVWPLLVLTPAACQTDAVRKAATVSRTPVACQILLAPGDCPAVLDWVQAETVISYGLSPRDSLTLSSLTDPVLCVQRALPRLDGTVVDPQEFPLPPLPGRQPLSDRQSLPDRQSLSGPADALLPLLGLRLLQMPLTSGRFP